MELPCGFIRGSRMEARRMKSGYRLPNAGSVSERLRFEGRSARILLMTLARNQWETLRGLYYGLNIPEFSSTPLGQLYLQDQGVRPAAGPQSPRDVRWAASTGGFAMTEGKR